MLPLVASPYHHPELGLSLWLPDDWNVNIDARSLTSYSATRDLSFEITALLGAVDLESAAGLCARHVAAASPGLKRPRRGATSSSTA
jgi:hypothetical protein